MNKHICQHCGYVDPPEDHAHCRHCSNEIYEEYQTGYCCRMCFYASSAEYEGSEYDLARENGENDFPTYPTPDPNEEL